jgi:[acyl-carrier-protein] S-malonyltransferase
MADAAARLRVVLEDVPFADPVPPLLANADADPIETAEQARDELVGHLTTGVDWVAAVERMASLGVDTIIEVGPGRVLTGLNKRIAPHLEALSTDDPSAPDRLAVPFTTPSPA